MSCPFLCKRSITRDTDLYHDYVSHMSLVIQIIKKTVIQVHRPNYEHRSIDGDSTNQEPYTMDLVLVQYNVLRFISPATLPLLHTHQGQRYSDKKRTYRAKNHK